MQQLMDPALHSPTGDAFRSGPGNVETKIISPTQISIAFPAAVAGLDRQFDQVAILSAHSPKKEMAVLGPFMVADYKPGASLLLKRNSNYWKSDAQGRKLPYLDSIQLDIQPNRDVEMLALQAWRDRSYQFARQRVLRQTGGDFSAARARRWSVARQRADVVQRSGQVSAAAVQEELVPVGKFPACDF